jgi:hypothetical protein
VLVTLVTEAIHSVLLTKSVLVSCPPHSVAAGSSVDLFIAESVLGHITSLDVWLLTGDGVRNARQQTKGGESWRHLSGGDAAQVLWLAEFRQHLGRQQPVPPRHRPAAHQVHRFTAPFCLYCSQYHVTQPLLTLYRHLPVPVWISDE